MLHTFASRRPYSLAYTLWLILAGLVLVLIVGFILALLAGIVWVLVLAATVKGGVNQMYLKGETKWH